MNKELKPCPFCGGEAQINERYRSGTANRKMYWVNCKACGISQQNTNVSGYRYQSKAIDRWNRREPIDRIVEELEENLQIVTGNYAIERSGYYYGKMDAYTRAIGIAKGGAV